jgi:hypothetical protein
VKRIFIGGIGRSGTTIALNALYRHPDVYAVPLETKFLVEEDGFADLIHALTDGFSTAGASVAVDRFEALMRRYVTGKDPSKFTEMHVLSSDVFPGYMNAFDRCTRLIHGRRYFADRAPLLAATRTFIAETFDAAARESGHAVWVEKTPSNIWRLSFLREIWPDCFMVHAIRDPRDILVSLMEKGWLPEAILPALTILEGYLAALLKVRRDRRSDPRFLEIRLEALVADPSRVLATLADGLGLAPFDADAVRGVEDTMARYYAAKPPSRVRLSKAEVALVDELLRPAVVELDYPPDRS